MEMELLTSKDNKLVKLAVRLNSDKKAREEEQMLLAEGAKLCLEGIKSGYVLKTLLITQAALDRQEHALATLLKAARHTHLITGDIAKKISDVKTPQGVYGLFARKQAPTLLDLLNIGGRFLVLDTIQDPGNMGTIIRTCEAFGLSGLVVSANCADVYSPKVLRATMGGVFRLPVVVEEDLPGAIGFMRKQGVAVYAATLGQDAKPLSQMQFAPSCAVVIGNEGQGISQEVCRACSGSVIIDMKGAAESLNAAVAASIFAWEMAK